MRYLVHLFCLFFDYQRFDTCPGIQYANAGGCLPDGYGWQTDPPQLGAFQTFFVVASHLQRGTHGSRYYYWIIIGSNWMTVVMVNVQEETLFVAVISMDTIRTWIL